jgi:site-specific recombinase XerC
VLVRSFCDAVGRLGAIKKTRIICIHGLNAAAAATALDHSADIAKVQEWLGHSNIAKM